MKGMKRREFLEIIGLGAAGSLIASKTAPASAQTKYSQIKQRIEFARGPSDRPGCKSRAAEPTPVCCWTPALPTAGRPTCRLIVGRHLLANVVDPPAR